MNITRKHTNKGFTLVELLVVIAIIAALAAMATPVIMKQQKKAAMIEATSNAKQVFYLLVDFDQEYGAFPDKADSGGFGGTTTTSNDVLKQLFFAGLTKSEEVFYAKTAFSKKPDGDVGVAAVTGGYATALEPGECGFLYIDKQSTGKNSARPILAAPLLDTATLKFDSNMYGGRMIALRIDGAVKQYRVDELDGAAKTKIGTTQTDIFGTSNPVWSDGTTAETIVPIYPSPKS